METLKTIAIIVLMIIQVAQSVRFNKIEKMYRSRIAAMESLAKLMRDECLKLKKLMEDRKNDRQDI